MLTITEVPSEVTQKLKTDHEKVQLKKQSAENQPFVFQNITDNTNTFLETKPTKQNKDTVIPSQSKNTNLIETTVTDFKTEHNFVNHHRSTI